MSIGKTQSRQSQNAAATRDALVRAARRLFAERGYADTGTEDLVRRARVTRGALYHHFKDKRALFAAVFDAEQARIRALAAEASGRQSDPWSALLAGAEAFLEACLDPAVQQIVIIDAPAVLGAAEWREADRRPYIEGTKQALEAAMAAGQIERQPLDTLANILIGTLHEGALLITQAEDKRAARADVSVVLKGLFDGLRRRA
jgi:AcrR family transcriptional regulator